MKKEVRLRTKFRKTVSPTKRGLLKDRFTTREWLKAFRTTIKPDNIYIIKIVKVKYRALMGSKY